MNQSKPPSTLVKRAQSWLRILISAVLLSSLMLGQVEATPVYALDVPTQIAPADFSYITVDDTPPLGIPEFKWAAVPGATSYKLQISDNIGFSSPLEVNIITNNTTYTPTDVTVFADKAAGDWYYWQVRVEAPVVGAYSDVWRFNKQWATPTNAPNLVSPADSATIDFYSDPIFSWNPVMGAAKYRLRVYSSTSSCLASADTATTLTTSYQPLNKFPNGSYKWCIIPVDPGNHNGTPSQERSFVANYNPVLTLLEPNPNVYTFPTFTPTFRWTAVRGAQFYRLQYATDLPFTANLVTIDTRNTAYTPIATLQNDRDYYWRVTAYSGSSTSASTTASQPFRKKWYIEPQLLTPVNNYPYQRYPFFSWAPVPGAATYFVELDTEPGFSPPLITSGTTSNTFFSPLTYPAGSAGNSVVIYWRVTPYDGSNKPGVSKTASFTQDFGSVAPMQVYPLFYYLPDTYTNFPGVTTNPHEDRTVPLPIFMWHRVFKPTGDPNQGETYTQPYRVQVCSDPICNSVSWTVDTQNTVAAPTTSNPFTPTPNTDYYWRVCLMVSTCGTPTAPWSQIWKTRFDPSRVLTPTAGPDPVLVRPADGFEFADTTPLFEWTPLSGAISYDVEISLDPNFISPPVNTATVFYPAYAPTQSLAQRNLGALNFGTYYWRVRKSGSAWPTSPPRRFQIAAESEWQGVRTLGDLGKPTSRQLQIGSDPAGEVSDPDYDVTDLQAAQSSAYWHFSFHVPNSPSKDVTYGLYLDSDQKTSFGATNGAGGYTVTTIPAHRPEYAIHVRQVGGVYNATGQVDLYKWDSNSSIWIPLGDLTNNSGFLYHSSDDDYVELALPSTLIGYDVNTTASYSASLLSLQAGGAGQPKDSVPSDPNVPGSAPISRFANVTERPNTLAPPNNTGEAFTYPSVLPFMWDQSVLAPWSGFRAQAHKEPSFTSQVAQVEATSTVAYYSLPSYALGLTDFQGDNSYYWRIQPRYRAGGSLLYGAWSQGMRFNRLGFVPQNLQISVSFATPTFSWDMVEGAEAYDIEVDNTPGFVSREINITTRQNSYTDTATLANGTYQWRVRARRYGSPTILNEWSEIKSFTLALPVPTGMTPASGTNVTRMPTLCWTPVIKNSPSTGLPVLAAWKYRVQVSIDTAFSAPIETIDTEQNCWTSAKGYNDGTYYWHVAMIDGNTNPRVGAYSAYQSFTKQYPTPILLSPTSGSYSPNTPTFRWTPVNGAATYELQTALDVNFSNSPQLSTTHNTRYTPRNTYAAPKTYYWRVCIKDIEGRYGPCTGAITLVIDPYPFRIYLPLIKR